MGVLIHRFPANKKLKITSSNYLKMDADATMKVFEELFVENNKILK